MVAGGIGDHAAGAIPLRNPADAVVGAAELEGTGALQRFRLQQYAPADALVEGGRFEKGGADGQRSEEHTSELQSLMRISYAVFCLKKKKTYTTENETIALLKTSTMKLTSHKHTPKQNKPHRPHTN